MLIPELDDVQYDLEVDGELVRRQLERRVWEERGRATIAIKFEERGDGDTWKDPKVVVFRFRRIHDAWKKEATITLSLDTTRAMAETFATWAR